MANAKVKEVKEKSAMMNEIGEVTEKYHEYFALKNKYNDLCNFVEKMFLAGICMCAIHIIETIINVL